MAHDNGSAFDWWSFLAKQGITALLAGAVLWFTAYKVVVPLQSSHQHFVDSIAKTNQEHAEASKKTAEVLWGILEVQRQIRDDQRRGVWRDPPTPEKNGS